MTSLKNRNLELILLNGIAIIVYTYIFLNLNIDVSKEIAFSTVDSKSYLDVANWLGSGIDSAQVSQRPILYPLIILFSMKIGGVYGIWIVQVLFWLFTINFIFLSVKRLTNSSVASFVGAFSFMINLSVIAMTLHALTEVTTIFLLSMMVFFLAKKLKHFREPHFLHTCLFFLVVLTLVKPVFSLPVYFILLVVFPLVYFRKYYKYPKNFLKLALVLLPLIIQLTIVKTKYNELTVSTIGSKTFTNYFVSQGVQEIDSIDREKALEKAMSFSKEEELDYVFEHLSLYMKLFWGNVFDNIDGKPDFLLEPEGKENYQFAEFMRVYNRLTVMLHYLFILLIIPLLIVLFNKKKYPLFVFLGFFYILGSYYVIVTGISYWQGDRLTLASIAIWACLYPSVVFFYVKLKYLTTTVDGMKELN